MGKEYDFQAAEETHGNRCLTYCKAACCRDTVFYRLPKEELPKFTRHAKYVEKCSPEDLMDTVSKKVHVRDGVYYAEGEDVLMVGINGPCPNLQRDNSCGIYDERPIACRKLDVGSEECRKDRRAMGLKPLENVIPLEAISSPGSFSFRRLIGR